VVIIYLIMFTKIKGDTNQVMANKKWPSFGKEDYTNHFGVNVSKKSDLGLNILVLCKG